MLAAIVFSLLMTVASAQTPWPKTVRLFDNATKATIGTATYTTDNKVVVRDAKGLLVGTVDRSTTPPTFYDPSGKVVEGFRIAVPAAQPLE